MIASNSGHDASITDFAQDRAALYFPTFGKGTVERWAKSGGAATVVANLGGRAKRIDERDLFVSDPHVNVIWQIPKSGGRRPCWRASRSRRRRWRWTTVSSTGSHVSVVPHFGIGGTYTVLMGATLSPAGYA
ncbi:MAG: hypothetical protein DYH12_14020 [Sorangiineae bacterium PRO1]|nr:hypothetical protein [Sorangiineae bacterium PRO1]